MKKKLRNRIQLKYVFYFLFSVVAIAFVAICITTYQDPVPSKIEREKINTTKNIVNDVTELNPIQTKGILVAHSLEEIIEAVRTHDHVSIGGGRNSMGGQTASVRAVQLDMREYNKILSFSTTTKEITVQTGITWRAIQDYIDPYNLSVKVMQTYSNFTVGGSLSVNVHGRYIGLGPIILTVKSFRIVLADGKLIEASPTKNQEVFYSAIGGMGGIGVITDITLSLDDNVNVERTRELMKTEEYASYFSSHVRNNKDVIFHNGDMYPPAFEKVSAVSWSVTDKQSTTDSRLIPRFKDYWKERIAWVIMSEWPKGRWIREYLIDPILYFGEHPVHTRNYEASYDVAELEPEDRDGSTYVLQEYFVPVENFDMWFPKMKKVFNDNNVNVINVSIRHALPDPGSKLAWARKEVFAFVVYYKQGTSEKDKDHVAVWTRQMIDEVIKVSGAYYLPYQLHATDEQLRKAYPNIDEYFEIKKKLDPSNKFTNALWDKYYHDDEKKASSTPISTKDASYRRPFANTYTSLPEWYIVYSADEFARVLTGGLPSSFSFSNANYEYWRQYALIKKLTEEYKDTKEVKDYDTVLKVIGVSFSIENTIKALYENTIGKVTEKLAGEKQTPEDKVARDSAVHYASFLYDYPWYDFPYMMYFKKVWNAEAGEDCCTFGQTVRRGERKIYLSVEFITKYLYSSAIRFATHQKFGVQDDIICATVVYSASSTDQLVCAPHYQPFTRELLQVLDTQKNNPSFVIKDIAGNTSIAVTFRELDGKEDNYENSIVVDRYPEVQSLNNSQTQIRKRVTALVSVSHLPLLVQALTMRGITIDHLYDY